MRNRKRVISLVLGLVMIVTSIIGPFALGISSATGESITSTISVTPNENVAVGNSISIAGSLSGDFSAIGEEIQNIDVMMTFEEVNITDSTGTATDFDVTTSVSIADKTISASKEIPEGYAGKSFRLAGISYKVSEGNLTAIGISGTIPEFSVAKAEEISNNNDPVISTVVIGTANDTVTIGTETTVYVTFTDNSSIPENIEVKGQIKKNNQNIENGEIVFKRENTSPEFRAKLPTTLVADDDYSIEISAKYGESLEQSAESKSKAFVVVSGQTDSNPKTPTVNAVFYNAQTPYSFERNTDQTVYVTFGTGENSVIQKVEATIRKNGTDSTVVQGWNGKELNGESGIAFTDVFEVLPSMELGEYTLNIKTTVKADMGYVNPSDSNISFSIVESTPAQFSFSNRRIITAPTLGKTYYEPNKQIEVGIKVSADRGAITHVKASVVSDGKATISESSLAAVSSSTGEYAGKITTPADSGDYRVVFSASVDNGKSFTGDNTPLVLSVRSPKEEDPQIHATIYSSTQGPATSNGYQVFKQGGTYVITVYSSNGNISFSDNITATITSYNGSYVYGPITLSRNGNNPREYVSSSINVPSPLSSNDYYVVTIGNGSVSYNIDGQTKTKAITPMPFIVESNRPNISSLTATYRQSSSSNTEVNRGFLTANNQIAYTAKVANYSDINSIKLTFESTKSSGSAGQPLSLVVMLTKYGNDGTYTGTYTVTNGNVGYTYRLQKVELYSGTNGSGNIVVTDTSSRSGLDFTVGTHSHTYANGWTYNVTHHWHASVCDSYHPGQTYKSGEAVHTFKTTVVKQATATEEGRSTKTCSVCQYSENVVIPKLGSSNALSTTAIENIGKAVNGSVVTISYINDNNAKLTKEVFDALKGTTKTLELYSATGIVWRFYGGDIAQNAVTKDISLQTSVASLRPSESLANALISQKVGNKTVLVNFPANGVLPGRAIVRIPYNGNSILSNTLGSRSGLNVYYYNPNVDVTRALELVARNVSVTGDGYVEFPITHNSTYVITNETVTESNENENLNNNNSNNNASNNNENNKPNSNNKPNNNSTNNGNNNSGNSGNSGNGSNASNTGNNTTSKPTTTTTIHKVIQAVSPKTGDLGYGIIWIMMFIAGALLVISSICMTRYEE